MYVRIAAQRLHYLAEQFPAVLILGARQVGKTTLARCVFAQFPYCDLEDPSLQPLFIEDARFQLEARAKPTLILDEAQQVPAVFAALRGIIDQHRQQMGRFILLGSAQPTLVKQVSESLAGRVGIVTLSPLTAKEISCKTSDDYQQLWLTGGFPDALQALKRGGSFRDWWEGYLRTYIERDLPSMGIIAEPLLLRRLLTMLAHQQGGMLNYEQLAGSLGVSAKTVQRYVDILEQSFLLRRLPPYFRNVGKRLVKAPKVYLRDTGLLHHLLNIDSLEALNSHPIRGASWESFVIEDLLSREAIQHPYSQAYFWRTANGAEVDLLLERGDERHLIEIKTARALSAHLARSLTSIIDDTQAVSAVIIDQGEGEDPLSAKVSRKGFLSVMDWLP
jgi:predicted AAA+ superfamily ATPase